MLFSIFRLANYCTPYHVNARFAAIERHYRTDVGTDPHFIRYYDENSRTGCHVIWQKFSNEKYHTCVETDDEIIGFYGIPFGYTQITGTHSTDKINDLLSNSLLRTPSDIEKFHPPFCFFHVCKRQKKATILTDVAGYARTFRLDSENGFVISNRSIAACFITLTRPRLSEIGWAAFEAYGYMFGEFHAFDNIKRNLPGAAFTITPDTISYTRNTAALRWFSSPAPDPFVGLERLGREAQCLRDDPELDVGITGGRDSRASAAWAYRYYGNRFRGRTSYPPRLEKILAKELVQRIPDFAQFQSDDLAVRTDGTPIWQGRLRGALRLDDIYTRARDWAFLREGAGIATALYNNCSAKSLFSPYSTSSASVLGNGGELAKAYAYRPMQVSGVFARDIKKWLREVRTIPAYKRLRTHPTTAEKEYHFARKEYTSELDAYISTRFIEAQDFGITQYRFFDYWYLVGRMSGGQVPENTYSAQFLPFLVPEFIRSAGTDTLERKINVQLSRDMVSAYLPSWSSVPYFDEIQNQRPAEDLRFFSLQEYLWKSPSDSVFFEIIDNSTAFDRPYYHDKIVSRFREARDADETSATLNVLAHGLLYRHAVYELAESVAEKIAELQRLRFTRWKDD